MTKFFYCLFDITSNEYIVIPKKGEYYVQLIYKNLVRQGKRLPIAFRTFSIDYSLVHRMINNSRDVLLNRTMTIEAKNTGMEFSLIR